VREHVLTVYIPAIYRIYIGHAVRVERWLAEVGSEGGVRQPSCGPLEVFPRGIRLHLLLSRLRSLLNIVLIDSYLSMMIFLLCSCCGIWLLLLLSGHELLRTHHDLIEMIANVASIRFIRIFLWGQSLWPDLANNFGFFHLLSGLAINEYAILISLLALPLVGTPLDLLDLPVLEALLQTLLPLFVPDLSILGETVVPEILRIAIVPVKHVLHTRRLYVLPEPLLPSELGLKLWVVLLDQVELHYGLIGFQVRQVVRRLG